jgi:hypothetical protein
MKRIWYALPLLLLAAPVAGNAAEQLIPAGSLIQCTVSGPKLSSKNIDVGDPVLCQISHFQLNGRPVFPYGSYLVGQFQSYKDPGHFVGKGWMDLEFDRVAMPPDQEIPIRAKVVNVPGYSVDKKGKIDGKGHPVRDAVAWSIPVLWPIDLLNLPRRGPRPVLKPETRLTLKVMEDVRVSPSSQPPLKSKGLAQRGAMSYSPPAEASSLAQRPVSYGYSTPPATQARAVTPPLTALVTQDGYTRWTTRYWFDGGTRVVYVASNGRAYTFPIEHLDLAKTLAVNREHGVDFVIRSQGY